MYFLHLIKYNIVNNKSYYSHIHIIIQPPQNDKTDETGMWHDS